LLLDRLQANPGVNKQGMGLLSCVNLFFPAWVPCLLDGSMEGAVADTTGHYGYSDEQEVLRTDGGRRHGLTAAVDTCPTC